MGIFKRKLTLPVPKECEGMEIKIQSSTCTGEKTIGFSDRRTGELRYPELVRSQADIEAFYEKYGLTDRHSIDQLISQLRQTKTHKV